MTKSNLIPGSLLQKLTSAQSAYLAGAAIQQWAVIQSFMF